MNIKMTIWAEVHFHLMQMRDVQGKMISYQQNWLQVQGYFFDQVMIG